MGPCGGEYSRSREQPVQRPWGRRGWASWRAVVEWERREEVGFVHRVGVGAGQAAPGGVTWSDSCLLGSLWPLG